MAKGNAKKKGKKFECNKSFIEIKSFQKNKSSVVRIEQLWRFATIIFPIGEVPEPNADGQYIDIGSEYIIEWGDAKDDDLHIAIKDKALREQVKKIIENDDDYEETLDELGFVLTTTFDLRPSSDGWGSITISDA